LAGLGVARVTVVAVVVFLVVVGVAVVLGVAGAVVIDFCVELLADDDRLDLLDGEFISGCDCATLTLRFGVFGAVFGVFVSAFVSIFGVF
jgi:hypothetical protein